MADREGDIEAGTRGAKEDSAGGGAGVQGNEEVDIGAASVGGALGEGAARGHAGEGVPGPFLQARHQGRLNAAHGRERPGVDGLAREDALQVLIAGHALSAAGARTGVHDLEDALDQPNVVRPHIGYAVLLCHGLESF